MVFLSDFLLFMTGACWGSFLACWCGRLRRGEKISRGRSHCEGCGRTLRGPELVPVFSYLFLKGRCRSCGQRIPRQDFLCEVGFGLLALVLYRRYGLQLQAVWLFAVCLPAGGICLTDLASYEIADAHLFLLGLLFVPGSLAGWCVYWAEGLFSFLVLDGSILLLSRIMQKLLQKEALGEGDRILIALMGLYFGICQASAGLLAACLAGFVLLALRRQERIPFGPCLVLGFVLLLLS